MASISDLLNSDDINAIARKTVDIGNVYRIRMTVENGIVPKQGDDSRNKFFVVLGFDEHGNVYGGVIINSHINANLPSYLKNLQMPIKSTKYKFLRYNSFVDCTNLKIARIEKFHTWQYLGDIVKGRH